MDLGKLSIWFCGSKYYDQILIWEPTILIFGFPLKLTLKAAKEIKAKFSARTPKRLQRSKCALSTSCWDQSNFSGHKIRTARYLRLKSSSKWEEDILRFLINRLELFGNYLGSTPV